MMAVSPELQGPDLHAWAGQHLEVSAEASPREAHAACLRKVAEHGWLPPPPIEESHDYLVRPIGDKFFPSLLEQAYGDEEYRLHGLVEAFAGGYFDYEPERRQNRYQVLLDQCAWSANLTKRLHGLAAGLKLVERPWEDAAFEVRELAEHVCKLFTKTSGERARRRWELLNDLENPDGVLEIASPRRASARSRWEASARMLQEDHPHIAQLEPLLVDELAIGAVRRSRPRSRLPEPEPAPAAPKPSQGSRWPIAAVVIILISLVRFIGSSSRQTAPPPPNFNPQNWQAPQQNFPPFPQNKELQEQLKKLKQIENERKAKHPIFDQKQPANPPEIPRNEEPRNEEPRNEEPRNEEPRNDKQDHE